MTSLWRRRAADAWRRLDAAGIATRHGRLVVREPRAVRAVPLWPFSQVLHATVAVGAHHREARHKVAGVRAALESYRRGEAYAERPSVRRRYYDDNAWIAVALLASGDPVSRLDARRVLDWVRSGADEATGGIGVRWGEGGAAHHACSTGSAGLAAALLSDDDANLLAFAEGCASWLLGLRDSDGLLADNRSADGRVDPAVFTYNQGLLIGLLTVLGRLDEATAHAERTVREFDRDRLWAHAPAFNGVLVRELMRLHAERPDDRWTAYAQDYLDRVWHEAPDPTTGLFVSGAIGRYDRGVLLDHAGLVVAMSALADVI
jgi:predicted alpha-1,6-mannanase (GH76 family)